MARDAGASGDRVTRDELSRQADTLSGLPGSNPLLSKRHRNPQTRAHAEARAKELAGLTVRLHAALVQTALGVRLP